MRNKSLWTETDKKMITPDGNVRHYIGSEKVFLFQAGDSADISFPNGYNKFNRVYKGYVPCINCTTVRNFIVKVEENE